MGKRFTSTAGAILLLLTACHPPSQNNYSEADVGRTAVIAYGTVKSERPVDITGKNSGTGAMVGVAGGALAGSEFGQGRGTLASMLVGAVVGGVAGAAAEQAMANRQGVEYMIKFKNGVTESIVQNIAKTDKPIAAGECVMVQFGTNYQRVLPDDDDSDCRPVVKKHKKHHHHHDDDDDDDDDDTGK
jgi:outer membrane lipoprotein SlyB